MRAAGFTLTEMLVGLLVVAVLATLTVPALAALRRTAAMSAAVDEMQAALSLARSTALMRGIPAAVCQSRDGQTCLTAPDQASDQWVVFLNRDGDQPVRRDAGEDLLRVYRTGRELVLRGTRAGINYWPAPRAGTTVTFAFCDARGARDARAVIVSQSGRARVSSLSAEGGPIACGAPTA